MSGAATVHRCLQVGTAVAVLMGTLCGCAPGTGATPTSGIPAATVGTRTGDLAPPLAGTSLEGHRLSLQAWRGSVAVVLFWASWCAPCQAEQPALNALAVQEQRTGVHFAGVSVDVDGEAARRYASRFGLPYDSLVDTAQTVAVDFAVAGPPTAYVIDSSGHVAAEIIGEVNVDRLRSMIAAARART